MNKDSKGFNGMTMGVAVGVAIGASTDNLALWLSLGIVIGAGFDYSKKRENNEESND